MKKTLIHGTSPGCPSWLVASITHSDITTPFHPRKFFLLMSILISSLFVDAQTLTPDSSFNIDDTGSGVGLGFNAYVMTKIQALSDGKTLVVGNADQVSTYNGALLRGISRINADGTLDTTFNPGGTGVSNTNNGFVTDFVIQPDGKIIIAGHMAFYNGQPTKHILRLEPDGTIDPSFNYATGPNSSLTSVALQSDGKIIISGYFTSYDGIPREKLARLNSDGSLDTSFDAGTGPNSSVARMIAREDGKVVVGGAFTSFNEQPVNYLVVLDSTGAIASDFNPGTGPSSEILDLETDVTGKTLIAGMFETYNGIPRGYFARINNDGSLDESYDPAGAEASSWVFDIEKLPNNHILLGGAFYLFGGTVSPGIVLLDSFGNIDGSFAPPPTYRSMRHVSARSNGQIVIAGEFRSYGYKFAGGFALLNSDGSRDFSFNPGPTGLTAPVNAVAELENGQLIVGGSFTSYNGVKQPYLMRLNADGSLDSTFNSAGTGADGGISAISVLPDGKILIGGAFTGYNGTYIRGLVRLDADGTLDESFNVGTGFNGSIGHMVVLPDNKILVSGSFTTYNDISRSWMARLNSDGTLDQTFDPGSGPDIYPYDMIVLPDGKIMIGGTFSSYNGTPRKCVARIHPDGALDTTFDPGSGASNGSVYTIAAQSDGKVILGGFFIYLYGQGTGHVLRLNADGSIDDTFTSYPAFNESVGEILILPDSTILFGGSFTTFSGSPAKYIVRLNQNGQQENAIDLGSGTNGYIESFSMLASGELLISGNFTSLNGVGKTGLAKAHIILQQKITGFPATNTKMYGDDPYAAATATSGLAITLSSSDPSVATVSGDTVTVVGLGQTTIIASQQGDNNYMPAPTLEQVLTVARKDLTIAGIVVSDKTYDGTTAATVTGTHSLDGIEPGDIVTLVEGNVSFADRNAGSGKPLVLSDFSIEGEDVSMYSLVLTTSATGTITTRELTMTAVTALDKVYDGTDTAYFEGGDLVGIIQGDTVHVTGNANFVDANAGAGKAVSFANLTLGGNQGANYHLGVPDPQVASITQLPLDVKAHAAVKTYGEPDTVLTYSVAPSLKGNDSFTGSLDRETGEAIGKYLIGQGTLSAGDNYIITFQPDTLSIEKKSLYFDDVSAQSRVYDGTTNVSVTTGALAGIVNGEDVQAVPGTASFVDKNVGTAKAIFFEGYSLTGADAGNYSFAQPPGLTADITPKSITLTGLAAHDKIYDGTTSAHVDGGILSGIIEGDTVSLTGVTANFSDKNADENKTVTVSASSLEGPDAGNYEVVQPDPLIASIVPATVNVYADKKQKAYGANDPLLTYDVADSVYNGDVFTGNLQRVSGENVGTYQILQGTLSGGSNYTLNYHADTLIIEPKLLTFFDSEADDKVYDGTTAAMVTLGELMGIESGDEVTLSPGVAHFSGKNVGTSVTVFLEGYSLAGADAGNYSLESPVITASITQKLIAVDGVTIQTRDYDGTTDAVIENVVLTGIIQGDSVFVTDGTASFSTSDAGTGKLVNVYDLALAGDDAGNYSIDAYPTTTGTIQPKPILIIPSDYYLEKIYGDTDPTIYYESEPALIDFDEFTGELSRVQGEHAATYAVLQGTLSAGPNYDLSLAPANFVIQPKTLLIFDMEVSDRVYDGTTSAPVTNIVLSGIIDGDDVQITNIHAEYPDKNANTGFWVTLTDYDLVGADGPNYVVENSPYFVLSTINPYPISVEKTEGQFKYYGEPDPELTYIMSDVLFPGDTLTGSLGRESGEDAGTYLSTDGDLTAGDNYELSFNHTYFTILPKEVTFSGSVADKTYDGTTAAVFEATSLDGVVPGDDVEVSPGTADFLDKNAGNEKMVQLTGFGLSGSDAPNYTLVIPQDISGVILPMEINVSASPSQTKIFGQPDPLLEYTNQPALVSGDSFSGMLDRQAGETPGMYSIGQGTLSAGANYTIVFSTSDFEIFKADQTIDFQLGFTTKVTTDAPFTIIATASSGLPVSFSISGVATLDGNTVTLTEEAGEVVIIATQTGDGNYHSATAVERTFEVLLITETEASWSHGLNVFPNPANSFLTIESGRAMIRSLKLCDLSGRIHLAQSEINRSSAVVDISSFESGKLMMVVIESDKGVSYRKILILR